MRQRQRKFAPRDQEPSPFASVLVRLNEAVGAIGAALVDAEGETVDYAASVDPFDIKVAAAELSVLLSLLRTSRILHWPDTDEMFVRGARKSLYAYQMQYGYALVILLPPHCFRISRRALSEAVRELSREAGLDLPAGLSGEENLWSSVEVQTTFDRSRRPIAIWLEGAWRAIDVLGRFREGLSRREIGYRARLGSGAELNLVREPLGRWYADTLASVDPRPERN